MGEKIEGASEKQKGQKLNFKENKENEWKKIELKKKNLQYFF